MRIEYHFLDLFLVLLLLGSGGFILHECEIQSAHSTVEVLVGSALMAIGLVLLYVETVFFIRWSRAIRSGDDHRAY